MTTFVENQTTKSIAPNAYWLFSAPVDLCAFLGSAVVSLLALAVGHYAGVLHDDAPNWAWVPAILLIDVAHVYSTGFRVYFDRDELKRRPLLYASVPLCGFVIGWALYSEGELIFWRVLAYLAVFHFVRQQYGWVALYRAKLGERERWHRYLDTAAIYLATIYPLLHWHAHLPRNFNWFLENDFRSIPTMAVQIVEPIYWLAMAAYAIKAVYRTRIGKANPGKDIVVLTTAVCWYVGIITFNSDYSFTVTNVVIHGVPYMVLIFWYLRARQPQTEQKKRGLWPVLVMFIATVWLLAYAEELLWDRAVWQEKSWLFGSLDFSRFKGFLVPLLAVPQLTHYVLDGFIWRRRSNPNFSLVRRDG